MRGIASIAKLVTPAAASALLVSAEVQGARWPIRTWPELEPADLVGGRGGDAKDHVGAPRNLALDDLGPGLRVLGVGMAGGLAGAGLDHDVDLLVARRAT